MTEDEKQAKAASNIAEFHQREKAREAEEDARRERETKATEAQAHAFVRQADALEEIARILSRMEGNR